MILEGFEIENWSCIKKVRVSGLPPTGVIVIHGPNRRGKSSIVRALRAALMDYASKTTALKSCYPRGTGEKPVVTVAFRASGKSYRIRKHFGSDKSELASQTGTGDWRVEATSATEAHDRTCGLVGGNDSAKGLHQLLWLTQAEFQLPKAKEFDAGLQSQLRGLLGVLQTPLDDRFIGSVKQLWNQWHSGQRKAEKAPEIKASCDLAANRKQLAERQQELQASDDKFAEVEGLLRQAADLEQALAELNRQRTEQSAELLRRRQENQESQARIQARTQAEKDHAAAEQEKIAALAEKQQRAEAVQRWQQHQQATEPARQQVETAAQRVNDQQRQQLERRNDLGARRDRRRDLQALARRVDSRLRALDDADRLSSAQEELRRVREKAARIAELETSLRENPAPDKKTLDALKENRQRTARLQADRAAASMSLSIAAEPGAGRAELTLDGGPPRELPVAAGPDLHAVKRKAELRIVGWGTVQFSRGAGQGDFDQIEEELRQCEEHFVATLAPLGIVASDPHALDQAIQREAEERLKKTELDGHKKELKKLAPQGLEPLQIKVRAMETTLNSSAAEPDSAPPLPSERGDLTELATSLQQEMGSADDEIEDLDQAASAAESNLDRARREETAAKEALAACAATARSSREELDRLRSDEQIQHRLEAAHQAVESSQARLAATELTADELTIPERLKAAQEAVGALDRQIAEWQAKLFDIKVGLAASEGLHAKRASLAARVDELTRLTQRESLERDAVDRLYELFEECREKQLGAVMLPIHDRVLGWMRVLDIGDYKEVRFNDAFLPDRFVCRSETAEFTVAEESTGAQEQVGMLVRLALGSILTAGHEPAVAILDDPLTHCDFGRLNRMRVILRRAAEGEVHSTPPAGPLQIVIFTCHPEWFRDANATVIDLENPEIMTRFAV